MTSEQQRDYIIFCAETALPLYEEKCPGNNDLKKVIEIARVANEFRRIGGYVIDKAMYKIDDSGAIDIANAASDQAMEEYDNNLINRSEYACAEIVANSIYVIYSDDPKDIVQETISQGVEIGGKTLIRMIEHGRKIIGV